MMLFIVSSRGCTPSHNGPDAASFLGAVRPDGSEAQASGTLGLTAAFLRAAFRLPGMRHQEIAPVSPMGSEPRTRYPANLYLRYLSLVPAAIVVAALYFGRPVLLPLAVGVLFAFALAPLVGRLRRIGAGRILSVLIAAVLAIGVTSAIGVYITTTTIEVAGELAALPDQSDRKDPLGPRHDDGRRRGRTRVQPAQDACASSWWRRARRCRACKAPCTDQATRAGADPGGRDRAARARGRLCLLAARASCWGPGSSSSS